MICQKKMLRGPWWVVALLILAGCGSVDFDRPLSAKVGWYGYLNGDDIRNDCRAGSGFHYRLTYNADYREHVRTYKFIDDGADGALLISRVSEGQGLDISRIFASGEANLSGWTRRQGSLGPAETRQLMESLRASGAFEPAPDGLRLYSHQFYWVSVLCHGGQIYFNAWLYPSRRYRRLSFPQALFALDGGGIAVPAPREVSAAERYTQRNPLRGGAETLPIFEIRVGRNGL